MNNYLLVSLAAAAGLAIALEGALYALFPAAMKRMMEHVITMPEGRIRAAGLLAAFFGAGLVWVILG